MTILSIIGTSGVGKSFLVKQLAAIEGLPAFFEGEEGTIPKEVLENVFSKKDSIQRYDWFLNHYKKILDNARKVSDNGLDCYTDCSETLAKAILTVEKAEIKLNLPKSDKTIILTASKEKLQELINLRARDSENNEKAIIRALKIQEHLIKLARKESLIIIDRSNLDFTKEEDLKKILKKIKSLN
ncbi:hypothetical protein HOE37_01580 [Candidatus Woesearchaeota archaeon]|jgi:deoxyadenosine/deoxycytidine kinase|nr:hypothetical protein [Candidatus Woesearchaeota archaeon]MBT4110526.1 hypothetical protein [Candidatus Woesearchaeota archaeon]MBT4335950.1 hypothetical protein [Candidatus Woesearchaeota archaeon]MBT4469071.1 hypothetical protein [Candidatus Woesearchaeota archaeon]MBT6744610.1 hypothetical protein [Candidatus Woesearchaeota archaeon]